MLTFNTNVTDIWVTSDSHYGHKNICRGTTEWDLSGKTRGNQTTRDFDTLEEMNIDIVNNINNSVKKNDILIHLGDWSFGGIDNIWNFRKQIKCKNIHLLYGNHDHHIKENKILPNVYSDIAEDNKTIIFLDKPKTKYGDSRDDLFRVNAQDLFSSVNDVLDFKVKFDKRGRYTQFFCSHYVHRIWDKRHHGRMHLFGHSHGSLDASTNDRSMDVGIDSAVKLFGEYRPFNILEVYNILIARDYPPLDHHNSSTN